MGFLVVEDEEGGDAEGEQEDGEADEEGAAGGADVCWLELGGLAGFGRVGREKGVGEDTGEGTVGTAFEEGALVGFRGGDERAELL